jgi:hypothetical protein
MLLRPFSTLLAKSAVQDYTRFATAKFHDDERGGQKHKAHPDHTAAKTLLQKSSRLFGHAGD